MSYDLSVYCPDAPTIQKVLLLVGNTRGLWCDPELSSAEASQGVLVHRGVKRSYSFTVDGPLSVEAEDLPDEVSGVLPEASTMFQVLVEGTVETEIPHGVRFARKLAKACHGVAMDEQTGEVWPEPRIVAPSVYKVYPLADAVEFAWYCLGDEMPADLPERYLRLAAEYLPEALPVRFGSFQPYQGDFSRDGAAGFRREWQESVPTGLGITTSYPVTYASLSFPTTTLEGDARVMRMKMAREALNDEDLRARTKEFFIHFAMESGAFHANAEVLRNYTLKGQQLFPSNTAEMYRYSVFAFRSTGVRNEWVGLKSHPQWWMWFSPLYADAVRPYLTGHIEEYPEGIFHSWTEKPADRDELTSLLPNPSATWIPDEFCGVYEEGAVGPTSLAVNVPPRLREVRMPLHQWEE